MVKTQPRPIAPTRPRAALLRDFRAGEYVFPAGSDYAVEREEPSGVVLSVLRPIPGVAEVGDLVGPVPREAIVRTRARGRD